MDRSKRGKRKKVAVSVIKDMKTNDNQLLGRVDTGAVNSTQEFIETVKRLSKSIPSRSFEWLIHPIGINDFFSEYWQKKPLHIKRNDRNRYEGLWGTEILIKNIERGVCRFGEFLNFSVVQNGKKVVMNKEWGSPVTIDDYKSATEKTCSVQFLHPQRVSDEVHGLLERLESFTLSLWGSNTYYTPVNSSGFAPHYDDVEVFMLQVEGSKKWLLTLPPDGVHLHIPVLTDDNQRDYQIKELPPPLLELTLEVGDLLYLPRGTVHYGVTSDETSHHITLSTYQGCSFSELILSNLLSAATRKMSKESDFNGCLLRSGLPMHWTRYMGLASSELAENFSSEALSNQIVGKSNKQLDSTPTWVNDRKPLSSQNLITARSSLLGEIRKLCLYIVDGLDADLLDDTADELASDFIARRLPPLRKEISESFHHQCPSLTDTPMGLLYTEKMVRFRNPSCIRLVLDDGDGDAKIILFTSLHNERSFHASGGHPASDGTSSVVIEDRDTFPVLCEMFGVWPCFIPATRLPASLVTCLHEGGLVQIKNNE